MEEAVTYVTTTLRNPTHTDCHGGRCRAVQTFDRHHIVHQAEGGPTTKENLADICPNEHRNQHDLDDLYDKHKGKPPWSARRKFPRTVQRRAEMRWAALQARKVVE